MELYVIYLLIVGLVAVYFTRYYENYRSVLDQIKYAKALFLLNFLMVLYLVSLVTFNKITALTGMILAPLLLASLWLHLKLMRTKSPSEIVYTTVFIVMCLLVFYHLYW